MEPSGFNDLFARAQQIGKLLANTFEDVTGEDLDLESAVRHYPLIALGLAAGAGLVGGWWIGHRAGQAPPSPAQPALQDGGWLRDLRARLAARNGTPPTGQPPTPLDFLDQLIPGSAETVRGLLPEGASEEAASVARDWLSNVVEPRLRQGLENAVESASRTTFGAFLRETLEWLEPPDDTELEDPNGPREPHP